MKPTLKLTLFIAFISFFSPQQSFAIAERDTVPTVQKKKLTPEESLKNSKKSAIGGSIFFLIQTTLLGLASKGITNPLVLALVKSAGIASLVITLLAIVSYFMYRRLLKKKCYDNVETDRGKSGKRWDLILSIMILLIGLISCLPLFFIPAFSVYGFGFTVKILNFLFGLLLIFLGIKLIGGKPPKPKN